MKKFLKQFFFNEKIVLSIIVLNAICIFLQESGFYYYCFTLIDMICTIFFMAEMGVKLKVYGNKGYRKDGWNRLDGTLVILSIPSVILFFLPEISNENVSVLLVLRLLRVLRFLRILHIFTNFSAIVRNFSKAMKESIGVFVSLFLLIIIFALLSCAMFKSSAPEYFATPIDSIYSIFRICTGEGWNEIPDTIAANSTIATARLVRLYFSILLILCSIIGLSLVNSIFVDAMVSDNNDELEKQVKELNEKVDKLLSDKSK